MTILVELTITPHLVEIGEMKVWNSVIAYACMYMYKWYYVTG